MFNDVHYLQLKTELNTLSEESYAAFQSRIIPDAGRIIGVRMGGLRAVAKRLAKDYFGYKEFFDDGVFEERMLIGLSLAYADLDEEAFLGELSEVCGYFRSWAEVDSFCSTVKKKGNGLYDKAKELIGYEREFAQRTGIVLLMMNFLDDEHIEEVINVLSSLKTNKYYVRMSAAWTLATAYINYPEIVYAILDKGLPDKETVKMTVRKCIDSYRISDEEKQRLRNI